MLSLFKKIHFLLTRTRYPNEYKHLFDGSTLSCYFSEEEQRIYHYYLRREMYRQDELRFWIVTLLVVILSCLPILLFVIFLFRIGLL
jgi:hypothetical protein